MPLGYDSFIQKRFHIPGVLKKHDIRLFQTNAVHDGHQRPERAAILERRTQAGDIHRIGDFQQPAGKPAVDIGFDCIRNDQIGLFAAQ